MPVFERNFELIFGDAIAEMKNFEPQSIDFVFADPPYHLSNGGFTVSCGKSVLVDKGSWDRSQGFDADYSFHFEWLQEVKRLLKPHGTVMVSGTYHSIYKCGYALEALGFRILNEIIWYKPNAAPNLSGRNFAASHETLIWASLNKDSKHTFNYEEMKVYEAPKDYLKNPGKQMRDVWAISTTPQREKKFGKHPTQKPLALMQRVISACTKKGDLVLDPFAGSGTTGVAALVADRVFIGIENNKEYLELSRRRLESVNGGTDD